MPSVLIVDDHETNARLMTAILKRQGITPRVATSGAEAIESCRKFRHDLILMDIQMPGMDGLEATRHIRKMESAEGLTPARIVAVTADILENCKADALRAGMDGYLCKPVQIPDIQRLIEELHVSISLPAAR
jgi:two-component system sensor histidine kinase BarA